jgi:amino acid transporter
MSVAPLKHWSAVLPLAMSIAALVLVLGHVAVSGGVRETDEGTAAHIWQLLMAAQVPVVAFFAITWLPRAPRMGLLVLALQAAAVLANLAAVRSFNL